MKTDIYKIQNSIEKVLSDKPTLFLDQNEFNKVKSKLKKSSYNIYYPYKDSEKVILYDTVLPEVVLFRIVTKEKLRHQDILGSILALNVSPSYLGDIIIDDNNYYFYILKSQKEFIRDNLISIGNKSVILEELDLNILENYEKKYETKTIIVTSARIDNILAKIVGTNRDNILKKIKDKEIVLNYEILSKPSYILKENDVFSVRKIGKFKFSKVVNSTKKGNLIVEYMKYL